MLYFPVSSFPTNKTNISKIDNSSLSFHLFSSPLSSEKLNSVSYVSQRKLEKYNILKIAQVDYMLL